MTLSPTPPQPITATREPANTGVVFIVAPTPVMTPQAIRQALSSGISAGILIAALLWTTVWVENVPHTQHLGADGAIAGALDPRLGPQCHVAVARVAAPTGRALLARGAVGDDHRVARLQVGDALADLLDDARALVPEHDRERHPVAVQHS